MAYVSCKLNLGLQKQTVKVESKKYGGKLSIETYELTMAEIPQFIANLQDVEQAYLSGPIAYTEKIKNKTNETEINKYSKTKTSFIII